MARTCKRCNHANTDEAKFCLQCGAMLEVESADGGDPLVGKIFEDRYRIVSLLGEGGMGKVYLAEQKMGTATRKVAIKTLLPELGSDPQLVARFHRECETVIELSHPNTVQFFDFGELSDGTLFIVMELIEGESLADVLQRGALDPGRVDKILIQICGSLHEAHSRGVVHRDLKPENILLTDRAGQTDFVKVLDFGIAKRSEADDGSKAKLTKQGMVLGTPPYMSPEQFSGQALDARSDIYSLGVMAYEMLTGRLPFEARTPWEWATKHLTEQPKPIELQPGGAAVGPRKRAAIQRALSKNRDERQPEVLTFLHEFTGLQDAQAAWTMATASTGLTAPQAAPAGPPVQPRAPVGTPGPMPQQGGFGPPAYPSGQQGPYATPSGPFPMTQTGGQMGYGSGSMEAAPARSGGGLGKVLAVLVILFFIVGGAAVGGVWYLTASADDAGPKVAGNNPPVHPSNTTQGAIPGPNNGNGSNVPSTPSDVHSDPPHVAGTVSQGVSHVQPPDEHVQPPDTHAQDHQDHQDHQASSTHGHTEPASHSHQPAGPSPADEARARALASQAAAAVDHNDLPAAVRALATAQRAVGRRSPLLHPALRTLGRKGATEVGILMMQGSCPKAQALYRQLRSVGAEGPSARNFSGDWCRRP